MEGGYTGFQWDPYEVKWAVAPVQYDGVAMFSGAVLVRGGLRAMVCAGLADRVSVPWPLLAGGRCGCAGMGSLTPWWAGLLCGNLE